jgi:hypothetical protein
MKSFSDIMTMLQALYRPGTGSSPVPHHSFGSSKRHNKRTAPNPLRRAHKPLYGGWAHQLSPIGQTPAPTIDQVKRLERKFGQKLMVTWQGVHRVSRIVKLNRFGKPMGKARQVPGKLIADSSGKILSN